MPKITRKDTLRVFNAMAHDAGIDLRIDPDASRLQQDAQLRPLLASLDNNFIMENITNVIRNQIYSDLKANELTTKDFGFWLTGEQGDEIIYENTIAGSSRTGSLSDIALISGEPENETQVLEFTNNFAVDIKENKKIQAWATLDKAAGWINKRYDNQKKSIDKQIHSWALNQIKSYIGYSEVLIDTTGLDTEQIAIAFESTIAEEIAYLGNDYSSDKNNLNFDNLEDPADIGMILSTRADVNRIISYVRKQVNMGDDKDWGLGHIISKPLSTEQEVILLPKSKWIGGVMYDSLDTALGFALIANLKTDYAFYGDVWMESAPSVRISVGTPATLTANLTARKDKMIANVTKAISALDELKNPDIDTAHKELARKQLKDLLEKAKTLDIKKIVKNARFIKPDLAPKNLPVEKTDSKNDDQVKSLQEQIDEQLKLNAELKASNDERTRKEKSLIEKMEKLEKKIKDQEDKQIAAAAKQLAKDEENK